MRFIFFIIALKRKNLPIPCKYILQIIYKLTIPSIRAISEISQIINIESPNLLFLPKFCNTCTKFKKDLIIFKKKHWCIKCFLKLKKEEGIFFIDNAKSYYFKNGLNLSNCEKCWKYLRSSSKFNEGYHNCEICEYKICSDCFDSFCVSGSKRCNHKPSNFFKIKN